MPVSPQELALDALAARDAGAFAVHVHPRDSNGIQTLDAAACDAAVLAIRAKAPGLPIGLSTAAFIDPDPFARVAAIARWREVPDFVSVNVGEAGWAGIARAALHAGVGIEVGLSNREEALEFSSSAFVHRVLRALVEVDGGDDEARAVAELIPDDVVQLWHGFGPRTWEVIAAACAAGHDVRVGLEDVLVMPDGRVAAGNAELVAEAVAILAN